MYHLRILLFSCFICFFGCKKETKSTSNPLQEVKNEVVSNSETSITHAKGFTIEKTPELTIIKVISPWPDAEKTFTYALIDRKKAATITLPKDVYDAIVLTPIENIVVTSTTHIPSLDALGVIDKLKGFPGTQYISSEKARTLIDKGEIKELGMNESMNTELTIALQPEVIIGFSINNTNKTYKTLQDARIPVVYNGDWNEQTPLGKAEWIKFFAPFFNKEAEANQIFKTIETEYTKAKEIAKKVATVPTALSGAMYKDIWYLPGGNSFQAQFFKDANVDYLWKDDAETGSLALNFETVLLKAQDAEFWISPGQFSTYEQMKDANKHYAHFKAFTTKNCFTFFEKKGATGGSLYYELASNRPDLVLKDLIKVFHPELLPSYQPTFLTPIR